MPPPKSSKRKHKKREPRGRQGPPAAPLGGPKSTKAVKKAKRDAGMESVRAGRVAAAERRVLWTRGIEVNIDVPRAPKGPTLDEMKLALSDCVKDRYPDWVKSDVQCLFDSLGWTLLSTLSP